MPNHKKIADYYENSSLSFLMDKHWLYGRWWKRKLILPNQGSNIMCPNEENVIVVPNHKKKEIIMRIHFYLIWWMNLDSIKNGGNKTFSCQTKASISYILIRRIWLYCLIIKRLEIGIRIQVCLIWWTNFDCKENSGNESFSCQTKASISCVLMWRTWLYCQ